MVAYVVDRLLLGLDVPFPIPSNVPAEKAALFKHHIAGHSRSNDEE
jgi:hypothetical protein